MNWAAFKFFNPDKDLLKEAILDLHRRLEAIERKDHPDTIRRMQEGGEVKEGWKK